MKMENLDFLPERVKVQYAMRRRLIRQGYLLGVCVLGLITLSYVSRGRISKAQAELDLLKGRSGNIARQLAVRDALQEQQADLLIKKRISDHLGSRINAMQVLIELDSLLPASMALRKLELETKKVQVPVEQAGNVHSSRRAGKAFGRKPKERQIKRIRVVLTGLAPTDVDIANFIGQLSASGVFEDVNMGYAKNVTFRGRSAREFQTSCYVTR
ncbi:MAG: PilN domain-containing protein [Planctomycetota bacterium]|nr:PilN domain-containing protein [Planctomycetota bacterium]